jgi:hypothetical protein
MTTRAGRIVALLAVASILAVACGGSSDNGPYSASIDPGVHPRLTADDAVRITRDFLNAQADWLAVPDMHTPARITSVYAVMAPQARALDGCIPSGQSDQIVWVTKGQGDYMNHVAYPWSNAFTQTIAADPSALVCSGNGTAGTIVIDDATGQILGVYPSNPFDVHPTAPGN